MVTYFDAPAFFTRISWNCDSAKTEEIFRDFHLSKNAPAERILPHYTEVRFSSNPSNGFTFIRCCKSKNCQILCALNGTPHCIAFKKQGLIKYLIACLFTVLQGTDYYLIKPIVKKTQFGPVQNRFGPTEGQGNTQ